MMENHTNQNHEAVASSQPFLHAEKEQLESLKDAVQKTGETTQTSASEVASALVEEYALPPEIQAKLDKLAEIEAAEKAVEKEVQKEAEETEVIQEDVQVVETVRVPPEIQAKLDKLAEIEAAEKAEQEDLEKDPNYVKFTKPYSFEGKKYKGIKLDFDEMTGADILEAEEEFIALKTQTAAQTPLKELSKGYLAFFAARACAQPVDFILGLDGKSFAKITRKAQSFLLAEG